MSLSLDNLKLVVEIRRRWKWWLMSIEEYSAQKIIFPQWAKNCWKVFPYILLSRMENFQICTFLGIIVIICQDFTLFGWKLSKNFLLSINIDKILFFLDGNCKNFPKKYKFGKNRGNFFRIFGPLGKYFYLHFILLCSSVNIFFISFFSKLNLLNY